MITKKIVSEVKEVKYFTIICDEVQDVAENEQIAFVARYVAKEGETCIFKEKFLGFREQHRKMSGEAIASEGIEALGLDAQYLCGQEYDGSGSMAGVRKGFSSVILQKYPLATYVHCCSHVLNLSIASACSLPLVRNMMGVVSEVSKFYEHGKRQDKLVEVIENDFSPIKLESRNV